MQKITEIYEQYKIMPQLAMHQFRVAAVAMQICKSLSADTNQNNLIASCLLHDMGNIIKSDFDLNHFSMNKEEISYWNGVKKEFIEKYGLDVSSATLAIASEIGVKEDIIHLIEHNDFKYICDISESDSLEKKILKYSDLRVGLHGLLSLNERFMDIINRYSKLFDGDRKECAENIENEIFSHSNIKPEDINDESVAKIIEELKNFEI
jgi:hypothetical protein